MKQGSRLIQSILLFINTPAQYHFWKYFISNLTINGRQLDILVRDYGITCQLLDNDKVKYNIYVKPDSIKYRRGYQIFSHVFGAYKLAQFNKSDIILGFGIVESIVSFLLKKPCIIFTDSEPMPIQRLFIKLFASVIVTPSCFNKNLGKKHIRIEGYKELAYLHPKYFKPDPTIFFELGLAKDEKYVILRFNVFDAVHDMGKHGFSISEQFRLVNELRKYAHVFISPEGNLPPELGAYKLPITYDRIHHALYYSQLLVTDTQTMTTEAAVLGTPVVRCNNFVGRNDMGNFSELENKYDLIYSFRDSDQAIRKATELIKQPDLKIQWVRKRHKLIEDKIDVTQFLVEFISNYPESVIEYKKKINIQE
jgi:uncharacterized protein